MIIDLSRVRIYIRPGQTDMRKAANGLTVIVQQAMELDRSAGAYMCSAAVTGNC